MSRLIQYWRIYSGYIPMLLIFFILTVITFLVIYQIRTKKDMKAALIKTIVDGCIFLSLAFIGFITLLPRHIEETHSINLQLSLLALLHGDIEYILNVVMFIPFSLSLFLGKRRISLAILAGILVSLSIETLQYILPIGRFASVNDLVLNTMGTVIGVTIGLLINRYSKVNRNIKNCT